MSEELQVYGRRNGKHRVVRKSDYKGAVLSAADRRALKAVETKAAWFGIIASIVIGLLIGSHITERQARAVMASVPYIYTSDVAPTTDSGL